MLALAPGGFGGECAWEALLTFTLGIRILRWFHLLRQTSMYYFNKLHKKDVESREADGSFTFENWFPDKIIPL